MDEPLTAAETCATLAYLLASAVGGTEDHWSELIEVNVMNLVFNIKGNWRVTATGTADERAAIMEAARLLAAAHPYVTT